MYKQYKSCYYYTIKKRKETLYISLKKINVNI